MAAQVTLDDRRSGFGMRCLPHPRTLTVSLCTSNGMKQRNVPFTPTIRKIGHVFEEEPGWNLAGGNPTEFSDTPSIGFCDIARAKTNANGCNPSNPITSR
ncbi:hypothetical protein CC2G_000392 [Coprinopsis cinerea AmutBmut pab1-1]|nr:hypothetical protein CC2G_000392 [Coprinopsis cinerea AmutBmut pab1-1]